MTSGYGRELPDSERHQYTETMTPNEIAQWMVTQLPASMWMRQRRIAFAIKVNWGEEHLYKNDNGNWAINPEIVDGFGKLTDGQVVWSRSRQAWRNRKPTDPPGRMVK